MSTSHIPPSRIAAFDLKPVDSQTLGEVVEEATAHAAGLRGEAALAAFARHSMQAAEQRASGDEAHALFTRAQIYLECLSSCAKQLAAAGMKATSEENHARLVYGLAHVKVKMAPRLDGAARVNYNLAEIIGIAKGLPANARLALAAA